MGGQRFGRGTRSFLAVLALLAVTAFAGAQEPAGPQAQKKEAKRVAVEYRHDPKTPAQPQDQVEAPRVVPDVPDELKVAPRVAASKAAAPRRAVPGGSPADPQSLGTAAGETMAVEAAREWGWRQYWRAGFHRGMRDAIGDPRPMAWERNEGFRYGRLDPAALALGGELARDAARDAAAGAAMEAVRAEFSDLTREPRRSVSAARAPASVHRWLPAGPWALAPAFEEVFVAIPFASAPGLNRDARAALDGWNAQPAVLARDDHAPRGYDAAWKDAAYAFSVWRDRQRPGSYWSQFGPGERDRYRSAFFDRFDEVIGTLDLRSTYAGYRVGYADGWRYGIAVNAEWNYRQGYAEGFDDGVRAAAALSFPFLFDQAYAAAYDAEFRNWANNPVPALNALRVVDGDDDGVIEPGERVELAGEVVNYGGAPGTFDVRVDGVVLDAPAEAPIRLPARSRMTFEPILMRVSERVAPRSRSELAVAVADDRATVPIYVSRPLEIDGDALVEAEPLAGRVRLALTVANRSRRPLPAEASVTALDGGAPGDRTEVMHVPAGGTARMEWAYDGIRPLDLLSGRPRWQAVVRHDGVADDTQVVSLAPAATNLADPDLVTYMLDLARSRQPSRRDIAEARALLLDRMRADWDRACAADGNPYRRDYEDGSASTALGELVRAVATERGSFANREVFAGAGFDIAALAAELPGAHPVLRKWMKRLAKRVG